MSNHSSVDVLSAKPHLLPLLSIVKMITFLTALMVGEVCGLDTVLSCILVLELKAVDKTCNRPAPVWKTSDPLLSLNVTDVEHATNSPMATVSGLLQSCLKINSQPRQRRTSCLACCDNESADAKYA